MFDKNLKFELLKGVKRNKLITRQHWPANCIKFISDQIIKNMPLG